MNEKDRRLADFCERNGYEGVLIRRRSNIAWASDGADVHCNAASPLGVASLLWTPAKKLVLTSNIESARLAEEEFGSDWEFQAAPWWASDGRPTGHFATDYPNDVIAELRYSLTDDELSRVRALGAESAEVLCKSVQLIEPGQSEHAVAGELISQLRRRGIHCPVVMVAADDRIARFRHPIPTSRRIEKAAEVIVCTRRKGLFVCLTRILHFGPISDELRRKHDAVCKVDEVLRSTTRPGVRWCDVLAAGIKAYEATGYPDEWKKHHQGGPLGYEPRDFLATPTETRTVLDNQLVGWNPSITGTKSEDTILSSGEVITAMPDWPMCGSRPDILCRHAPRRAAAAAPS